MPANYLCTIGLFGVYCLNRVFVKFHTFKILLLSVYLFKHHAQTNTNNHT